MGVFFFQVKNTTHSFWQCFKFSNLCQRNKLIYSTLSQWSWRLVTKQKCSQSEIILRLARSDDTGPTAQIQVTLQIRSSLPTSTTGKSIWLRWFRSNCTYCRSLDTGRDTGSKPYDLRPNVFASTCPNLRANFFYVFGGFLLGKMLFYEAGHCWN